MHSKILHTIRHVIIWNSPYNKHLLYIRLAIIIVKIKSSKLVSDNQIHIYNIYDFRRYYVSCIQTRLHLQANFEVDEVYVSLKPLKHNSKKI